MDNDSTWKIGVPTGDTGLHRNERGTWGLVRLTASCCRVPILSTLPTSAMLYVTASLPCTTRFSCARGGKRVRGTYTRAETLTRDRYLCKPRAFWRLVPSAC